MSYVEFKNVSKTYKTGDVKVEALKDASFEIGKGEICVIVGQSGAGKTTLLNILGGMDRLTEGEVYLDGTAVSDYTKKQLATYRRRDIGFVFQFYNLIPNLTALETGKAILKLLQDCSRKRGMTVVIITHNQALTAMADRIIKVKSGKIASVKMNEQIVPVEEIEW